MPLTQHSKRIAPKINNSELYIADTGSANAVTAIPVPAGVVALVIWFDDGTGTPGRGRVGFAGEEDTSFTGTTDGDDTSGHIFGSETYSIPSWAKVIHVSTALGNAEIFGTWFYD